MSVFALLSSGCGTGYLLQAARGQWQVQRGRQPLATVIANPSTDDKLRTRLQSVSEARAFASRELGLPDNRSYSTYRALGRDYVVWNVVAAPEFSLAPRRWCFAFVGCLSYRGYFHEAAARRYAEALQRQRFDVSVNGVSAYSTLGHFADPVLDTMMRYGDVELIGILFHELAHQQVYARSDSEFNESFATAVEREGLRRWLDSRGQSTSLPDFARRERQQRDIQAILMGASVQLRRLYAQDMTVISKREQKRALLQQAGDSLRAYEKEQGIRLGLDVALNQGGLNNSHLVAVSTYEDCVPAFMRLLAAESDDLRRFYAAAKRLAIGPAAERQRFCTTAPPV
jgi:predicted aminopeptidase